MAVWEAATVVWTSPTRTMPAFKPLVSCEKAAMTSPTLRQISEEEEKNCRVLKFAQKLETVFKEKHGV
jgi:hypothetical protein